MESKSEHTGWLGTSVSCCLPWSPERPRQELDAPAFDSDICTKQPGRIAPPSIPAETPQSFPRSRHVHSQSLSSQISHRTSLFSHTKCKTHRPTISGPFDFQQVATGAPRRNGSLRRTGSFRPLQLSIYMPGNELSPLPHFHTKNEWEREDKTSELQFPAPALTKTRSDTMLSRASTTFTIPRKPVPSRAASMDATSRISMDSNYTCAFSDYKYASETFASQTPRRRPSVATTLQSTQDFLDALDARLPRSPPAVALSAHSSKTMVAEPPTVYRRASEQSLRLRTHLEERQQIERKGMECDTILEDNEKTPILEQGATFASSSEPTTPPQQQQPAPLWTSQDPLAIAPTFDESAFPMPPSSPSTASTKRSRISAWLLRSMTSKSTLLTQSEVSTPGPTTTTPTPSHHQILQDHDSPTTRAARRARDRDSSSTASTLFSTSAALPLPPTSAATADTKPSSQAQQYFQQHSRNNKGGSVSTTWTSTTAAPTIIAGGRGMSLDFEKIPVLPSTTVTEIHTGNGGGAGVGMAF